MTDLEAGSIAFREALLRSEHLRIRIVLGAVLTAFLMQTIRAVVIGGRENLSHGLITAGLLWFFVSYELVMLSTVKRAIRKRCNLSNWVWLSNIVLETSLPAFAIAFVSSASIDRIYRPLANPVVLGFFLFISLSMLRLDPARCRVSGLTAAVSYLLAATYLGWRPSVATHASLLSPEKAVFGYAIIFVMAGFVMGVVAKEVRKQVEAALCEAAVRRQVDRLEHDLGLARSIQRSLLPTTIPEIDGFEIAGWNQPADQTGGDYYDWQALPNGKLIVVLADVTGHGIGPALLASACRAYARANFSLGDGLWSAMEHINAALATDIGEGRFITFVAAVCDPRNSSVQLLSAGHGPIFLYVSNEDRFEDLPAQGPPFGISPSLISEPPHTVQLSPGDLLVLATDGFWEWVNPQEELFGSRRLQEAVRKSKDKAPPELIADLYRTLIDFSGGTKQQDDLTAVVIKRKAGSQQPSSVNLTRQVGSP